MPNTYDIALSFATEEESLVETVYHYLKAEGLIVFFAPMPECQVILSGKNQREIFYRIFGIESEYVALFVSKHYVIKDVPMEEASIAFTKHNNDGKVIPIYLDGTHLPSTMLNPKKDNYFASNNAAVIANHIAERIKNTNSSGGHQLASSAQNSVMNIKDNNAQKQVFVQMLKGDISL